METWSRFQLKINHKIHRHLLPYQTNSPSLQKSPIPTWKLPRPCQIQLKLWTQNRQQRNPHQSIPWKTINLHVRKLALSNTQNVWQRLHLWNRQRHPLRRVTLLPLLRYPHPVIHHPAFYRFPHQTLLLAPSLLFSPRSGRTPRHTLHRQSWHPKIDQMVWRKCTNLHKQQNCHWSKWRGSQVQNEKQKQVSKVGSTQKSHQHLLQKTEKQWWHQAILPSRKKIINL